MKAIALIIFVGILCVLSILNVYRVHRKYSGKKAILGMDTVVIIGVGMGEYYVQYRDNQGVWRKESFRKEFIKLLEL